MRILCFGDSNTFGYDPRGYFADRYDEKNRWVDLIAEQTGWEMINEGINGREIPRNPYAIRILNQYTPIDCFLVMLGTNDLLQGSSAEDVSERMASFLQTMIPHCQHILLVSPPPMKRGAWVANDQLELESYNLSERYKCIANKFKIHYIDTNNWNIELAYDGVHFTEAGHQRFADLLIPYLKATPPEV